MKQELGYGIKYFFYALLIVVALWGVFALVFGTKIMTFDAPLILEAEPVLIQPGVQ